MTARRSRLLGGLALAIYVLHTANHLAHGRAYDLLWVCNLATALLAIGCLARAPALAAISLLWLCVGTALWLLDAFTGGEVIWTGILTHVGGTAVAAFAVAGLGMPRGTWYRAVAAAAVIVAITRLVTSPEHNVNLAFAVREGWEARFSSHLPYLGLLFAVAATVFFGIERGVMLIRGGAR